MDDQQESPSPDAAGKQDEATDEENEEENGAGSETQGTTLASTNAQKSMTNKPANMLP